MGKRAAFVLLLLLSLGFSRTAFGGQVTLAWDPNSEPELSGYRLHQGVSSGEYTTAIDVGNTTSHTIDGLADGQAYFFVATAYDSRGRESGYSNEVSFTTLPAPNAAPTDITVTATSVLENRVVNYVMGTFSTVDPEGGTFTYSLVAGEGDADNASFNILARSLRVNGPFDYETRKDYSIRVRSTDSGGEWLEKAFSITVKNQNEAPTDITVTATSVLENRTVNDAMGTFSTVDTEGGTFVYSLVAGAGDADNASFNILARSLRVNGPFDYETRKDYSIRVRSTDSGGKWLEKAFNITVEDQNEEPTDITVTATSVLENRAVNDAMGTFSTVDPEGGTFVYSLVAGAGDADNASFSIGGTSLLTAAVFDFEAKNSYTIRVRSSDSGGRTVEKVFAIAVEDAAAPAAATRGIEYPHTSGATLRGEVNPRGAATTAWFEWGTDGSLAAPSLTGPVDLGDGTDPVPVSLVLGSLTPGVTYYFRVVAQSGEGTAHGAIDYFALAPANSSLLVVNSADDVEPSPPGKMTLREAVARVDSSGTITFDQRLDGARIDLSIIGATDSMLRGEVFAMVDQKWVFEGYQARNYGKSALYADKSITIDASSLPNGITLAWAGGDASHARVLAVSGDLTMSNVTVTGGYSAAEPLSADDYPTQPFTLGRGGGIAVWGTATLVDCTIAGNRAVGDTEASRDRGSFGGGIYADTVNLTGCVVSGNTVAGYGGSGGGVFSVGGVGSGQDSYLRRSAITGNRVTAQHAYGGGVSSDGGGPGNMMTMNIQDCTVARNLIEDNPGITESVLTQYYYRGGGFYLSHGILTLSSSTIVENAVAGIPAIFSGKPNMGGGGIAAAIGDAHVVEYMDIRHSIIAGNTLGDVPSDVSTGSLLDFYSTGYNLIGTIDFSQMLVPVPSGSSLNRRHYPKVGDQDGVAVADVLDLGNVRHHDDFVSAGADEGGKAALWYPPRGVAVGRIPPDDYLVTSVWAGYESVDYVNPVDDFPSLVLDKINADYGYDLRGENPGMFDDLSSVVWFAGASTWPSDPQNDPWISFWRNVDTAIGNRLGAIGLGDDFWGTFEEGPFGLNVSMSVSRPQLGPILRSELDQRGAVRSAGTWVDIGAVQSADVFTFSGGSIDENLPPGTAVGAFGAADPGSGETFIYTLVSGPRGTDNAVFSISEGTLFTAAVLDFEARSVLSIMVRATGQDGSWDEQAFTITVRDVNESPVAVADAATGKVNSSVVVTVRANDSDPDGDGLTVAGVTQGAHGTVSYSWSSVRYTPAANWVGSDSFTYTISDGKGGTAVGTVSVTVKSSNHPPVAAADAATVNAGSTVVIAVRANDSDLDGDGFSVVGVTQGTHGTVSYSWSAVQYTPDANWSGSDNFTYTITDGLGGTAVGTVSVTVIPMD